MKTLREYIQEAEHNKRAIAHFNVANSDMLMAVFSAAQKLSNEQGEKIPVVIGVSEGERDAFGVSQIVDYVISLQNEHDYPIFINADHTYSVERACEAIDAGFDMVVFDNAARDYETNLEDTRAVVAYRDEINPECLVEAELGFIGSGSNIKDILPQGVSEETMTNPKEALDFVKETNIDLLAPSVGNVHGLIKTGNPALNPQRIRDIRESSKIPLVLHGGSGISDEDFLRAIDEGIVLIHISTELRVAYRKGLEDTFREKPQDLAPYSFVSLSKELVGEIAYSRMKLFWKIS